MPSPAVTLKLKRFRRHFGIAAPRVVVRSHWPWQIYGLFVFLSVLAVIAIVWGLLRNNQARDADQEMEKLRQQLARQSEELIVLRSAAGTEQNTLRMERSTQQQLLQRIQILEAENNALREEALLFERLTPSAGGDASVRIENFRVFQESPGQIRYRILLTYQPSKQAPEFRGTLRLLVKTIQGTGERELLIPGSDDKNAKAHQLEFRYLLRKEGSIELPRGARLKSIDAQIWSADSLQVSRQVQL